MINFKLLAEKQMAVIEGTADATELWAELYDIEKKINEIKEALKPIVIRELEKEGVKNGFRFQTKCTYSYDFGSYNDTKEYLKRLEKLSQAAANSDKEIIDEITGEIIPPAKKTISSFPVKC